MDHEEQVWLAVYTAAITAGRESDLAATMADFGVENFRKFRQRNGTNSLSRCGGEEEDPR